VVDDRVAERLGLGARASAIQTAGSPKAGSVVGTPASWPIASPASIASWCRP
jgi:hypothetical protein